MAVRRFSWVGVRPTGRTTGLVTSQFLVTLKSLVASYIGGMATTSTTRREPAPVQEPCLRGDAALARAFGFLGKRWNAVVLGSLSEGPAGFRELSRAIGGISDSVLSDRLAGLCKAGLLARTVEEGPPVTVSYALTDRGAALIPALEQISQWAEEHLPPGE
jgi:DNA-binding HxlR family transcriptional regulator